MKNHDFRNNQRLSIRRLGPESFEAVKALVLEVFMQFEAPDYGPQGMETFKRVGIEDASYMASLVIYGAYVGNRLVGVIATRHGGDHIALFFVKGRYHRQGIGHALFDKVKRSGMTVNASPYAEKVYEHLGFLRTDEAQTFQGIRFVPMRYEPAAATLMRSLTEKDTKEAYQALLQLEIMAETSSILYPYTQKFAEMVESPLYNLRVRGFRLFCHQAKWDVNFVIDDNIEKVLTILHDPKPTAVRMALAALQDVWEQKPELRDTIEKAVRRIPYARYKDSMRGLISKDAQKLLIQKRNKSDA